MRDYRWPHSSQTFWNFHIYPFFHNLVGKGSAQGRAHEVSCFQGLAWRINWICTHLQVLSELTGFYDCDQKMKGEKKHAPAWCDPIICFGEGLKQQEFSRGESRLSDHRPVRAIFVAESDVSSDSRSLGSSFTGSFNFLQDLFKSALIIRYHVMSERAPILKNFTSLFQKTNCYTWDHI
jgi:hypothetical protein